MKKPTKRRRGSVQTLLDQNDELRRELRTERAAAMSEYERGRREQCDVERGSFDLVLKAMRDMIEVSIRNIDAIERVFDGVEIDDELTRARDRLTQRVLTRIRVDLVSTRAQLVVKP
jgi:hypothetical protein